jgi:hypothetical protein
VIVTKHVPEGTGAVVAAPVPDDVKNVVGTAEAGPDVAASAPPVAKTVAASVVIERRRFRRTVAPDRPHAIVMT